MKKILSNNKGFALVETIIVSVFMVSIFMILYSNYYPLMGRYEKREYYDDVDTKYKAFWLKYMVEDSSYILSDTTGLGVEYFGCNKIDNASKRKTCINLVKKMGLTDNIYCKNCNGSSLPYIVIIAPYTISGLKTTVANSSSDIGDNISDGFLDYILSLPDYNQKSGIKYPKKRILIEFYDKKNNVYKYANIEVNK